MGDVDGLPSANQIITVLSQVRDIAKDGLPKGQTLEVQGWDDGDFTVRCFHTEKIEPGEPGSGGPKVYRKSIRYDYDADTINYLHFSEQFGEREVLDHKVLVEDCMDRDVWDDE